MFAASRKTTRLTTPEEQEIIHLQSQINQLNADLTFEKTNSAVALSEEKNKHITFVSEGRVMERERIIKISKLPEFKGREDIALKMALSQSPTSPPESIGLLLRNIPKKETTQDQFSAYMLKLGNPDINPGIDMEDETQNSTILQSIACGDV